MNLGVFVTLSGLFVSAALGQQGKAPYESSPDTRKPAGEDRAFVIRMIQDGMNKIEISKLASSNSQSGAVRQLAAKLAGDQSKIESDLRTVAGEKNWDLPAHITKTDQSEYRRLQALHGAEFDQAYLAFALDRCHFESNAFKQEAENGRDKDLRDFAERSRALIQDNMTSVEGVQKDLTKSASQP